MNLNTKIKPIYIIAIALIIKTVADYITGGYYDKDAMICFWLPLSFLFYTFIAIQFFGNKQKVKMWILFFVVMFFQEIITTLLVTYDVNLHFSEANLDYSFSRIYSLSMMHTFMFGVPASLLGRMLAFFTKNT